MRVLDSRTLRPGAIADAVAGYVQRGGSVIFPTDTVYGIGSDPVIPAAVERIFVLKGRPRDKPLSLHFGSVEELLEYAPGNVAAALLAEKFLPGALTLIVRRPAYVDASVTVGLGSVGLRVPRHELCRLILERCGPLAATSANLSGAQAFTGEGFASDLPAADVFVDDGPTPLGAESTIVDVSTERPRLVREGAISVAKLEEVVGVLERSSVRVAPEKGSER